MALDEFVNKHLNLINIERDAEILETRTLQESLPAKELERRGICLLKLEISEKRSGLYGRSIVVLEPFLKDQDLPSNNFSPGDIAGLIAGKGIEEKSMLASGIVTKVTARAVSLAFDESFDNLELEDETHYNIVKLANDVTYRRLKRVLNDLQNYHHGVSSHLISVLFGESPPRDPLPALDITFFNNNLDGSQRDAVRFALSQKEVAVVHGPPGTGKTTTIVEIIRQAVKTNLKVLACAPSNIAVDNLVERLGAHCRLVRLGHPARLLPHIHKHSLDAILASSEQTGIVQDVRRDLDQALKELHRCKKSGERNGIRNNLKSLRKELRQRETAAVQDILSRAQVVLATLTGASDDGPLKLVKEQNQFDLVIIDEASQALEASCWIGLLKAPRCILAGDHNQLPPTIISNQAAAEGLSETLMERVIKLHGDVVVRMLTTQYRMHEDIMKFSSEQLYDGRLVADASVAKHLLRDLAGVMSNEDTETPLLLIDTAGCDLEELALPEEFSKANEGEAEIVARHVENLVSSGLPPSSIAVIAPYNLQVDILRLKLTPKYPDLEIKSVDGFQGREKEAVIISLVRSNQKGEVGFLAEDRRINVAITRARRHLAVICDSVTVSCNNFIAGLVAYMMDHGEVRSAHAYLTDGSFEGERYDIIDRQLDLAIHKVKQEEKRKVAKQSSKVETSKAVKRKHTHEASRAAVVKTDEAATALAPSELQTRSDELQQEIEEFLSQQQLQHLAFPASLTSKDRFTVHQLCESLGLIHISQGEGSSRQIIIEKPPTDINQTTSGNSSTTTMQHSHSAGGSVVDGAKGGDKKKAGHSGHGAGECVGCAVDDETVVNMVLCQRDECLNDVRQAEAPAVNSPLNTDNTQVVCQGASSDSSACGGSRADSSAWQGPSADSSAGRGASADATMTVKCSDCGNTVPKANKQLHDLWCRAKATEADVTTTKKQSSGKSRKKGGKKAPSAEFPEDEDELLDQVIKENKRCALKGCKLPVVTFNLQCTYCGGKFCSQHFLAEVHGCGEAAKFAARKSIKREGKLFAGSGVPDKKPTEAQRNQLKRKLDSKINQLADKRKGKQG